MEDQENSEGKLLATFERHGEFINAQQLLLSIDLYSDSNESTEELRATSYRISQILNEYQEQSYLLDPYLEGLLLPVVERLKSFLKTSLANPERLGSPTKVNRLALLLRGYIKCRGYKPIIRYFPHEIADLSIVLDYMLLPNSLTQDSTQWALRYVILLWLSLICMIPFDLEQFDEPENIGHTAGSLERLAKQYLSNTGLESDAAALLLTRLYTRKDTGQGFDNFVKYSAESLSNGSADIFASIGLLQVLCAVCKSGSAQQITSQVPPLLAIADIIDKTAIHAGNSLLRKYRTKLISRIALRLLPQSRTLRARGKTLDGEDINDPIFQREVDVPEEVDGILEQLFSSLQDKDTTVRWSAAKAVARIAERLPEDFADQVLETIMSLFAIHSIAAATLYDIPAIAEGTWHGACLACAEMARRNLVSTANLPQLIDWLSKALYFDLRKGAHSIGSNVRDAASYVLWALARTQNSSALITHAENLARRLVTVSLFDREIHIRRAASAAFQEHVGRNSLFPHGIDVLAKTDFYAVSLKKHAFLVSAPLVAQHVEYRHFLLDHVLDVVIRHWDSSIRRLGAQSLREICLLDMSNLGPEASQKVARLFSSVDASDLHGALLVLGELAIGYRKSISDPDKLHQFLRDTFAYLSLIPSETLFKSRNEILAAAACNLVENSITDTDINLGQESMVPNWRQIINYSLKHKDVPTQEAGATAMAQSTLITDLRSGSPAMQQSLARVLGAMYYTNMDCFKLAFDHLLQNANSSKTIETRRLCYISLPKMLSSGFSNQSLDILPDIVTSLFRVLQEGLTDYTIDERGDVGSWLRIVCIQGLTTCSKLLLSKEASLTNFEDYLPPNTYHDTVAGILKQGVERLDNVRQVAGDCFMQLLDLPIPSVQDGERWRLPGEQVLQGLFTTDDHDIEWNERFPRAVPFKLHAVPKPWNDSSWLFPRAVRLLDIKELRDSVLSGILISLASRTDSTQRPMASSLVEYVQTLPVDDGMETYSRVQFVENLLDRVRSNLNTNAIAIPIFQTFNVVLEGGALQELSDDPRGLQSLEVILSVASRNVTRLKSIQRLHESMKIVVNLLSFNSLFAKCVPHLNSFLTHPFPHVRTDTAEYLYLVLESADLEIDTDDAATILLETEWSVNNSDNVKAASERVVQLMTSSR